MKHSSIRRQHTPPEFTRLQLRNWLLSTTNFLDLHANWVASDFCKDLAPSLDRQDEGKGYSFDNIKLVTWASNNSRQSDARYHNEKQTAQSKPVIQCNAETGEELSKFVSISAAARSVNGSDSALGKAMKNGSIYKTFSWLRDI